MTDITQNVFYFPNQLPADYNATAIMDELHRIALAIQANRVPKVTFVPQGIAPTRYEVGDVINADGTNWDPGSGAGLYERTSGGWSKL